MQPNDSESDHWVLPDQLRVGLYINVGLPWFRHPFTLSSFKISSHEQIRDLRALKVARFRFDPALSDIRPDSSSSEPAADPAVPIAEEVPEGEHPHDPVMAEKQARIERLGEHRKAVAQMERAFVKTAAVMRSIEKNLFLHSKETLEQMHELVHQMAAVFLDRLEVTLHVMGGKSGGDENYYHSLNVSILCMMLAKDLEFDREQFLMLGAGAMLHDIGLKEIPARVLKKPPEECNKAERELRAMHVPYGVKMGMQLGLAPDVLSIIAQHHELADGSGYPRALKLEQIMPLARVVSLVNYYDNLCNPVDFARAMTPHEALSIMFAQRRDKFDARILQLMIRSLGVYPPGTLVKLSNDALAMVISVNPQKSLRPWVLLYDAGVSREEAIMLNLELETDLNIGKAIRPAMLPPPVYAYLSPSRRIKYFFDSESASAGDRP